MVQGGLAGKISKPYGLQGEVQAILNPLIVKYIKTGIPLFIDIDGQRVPFFTESADVLSDSQAIVKFEFIHSVEEARKICGCDIYFDPKGKSIQEDADEEDPARVVGYHARDQVLGDLGEVTDFYPGKANPVWLINYQGKEIMVPAAMDLIGKIDHKKQIILLNLPEGITDL